MTFFSPFRQILDLLLPPRCLSCQSIVATPKSLCSACWEEVNFISAPFCACCGLPFEFETPDQFLCLDCTRCAPPFEQARSVLVYDEFSKNLILSFKHGDRTDLAPALSDWLCRTGRDLVDQSDVCVPVPLHWRRLAKRRFNQAGLLAQNIAKNHSITYAPHLLKRHRATDAQGHLSRMARQRNLQGAFRAHPNVRGRRVLLIDDVLTTGATVLNCTDTLLRAGACEVRVLTLARVLHIHTQ